MVSSTSGLKLTCEIQTKASQLEIGFNVVVVMVMAHTIFRQYQRKM